MTTSPVNFPIMMARCPDTRTDPCGKSAVCARALASAAGRPVQDYSIEKRDAVGACTYYLSAENFRPKTAAPARRLHEAPQGIFRV